jgi:hypothetical protein
MKHKIHYLNNGKIAQNYTVKSSSIKNTKIKSINATNGKLFTQELAIALKKNNIKNSSLNKNESTSVSSWLLNTLNPVNHLPIISTLNNMANKTSKSLDIVQSAIGGALYGGGPIGLAKGIGGWFLNKLIPKDKVAIKPKSTKESNSTKPTLKEDNKLIEKPAVSESFLETSKSTNQNRTKQLYVPNSTSVVQKRPINKNFYHYHSIGLKQKMNIIDTDA